MLSRLSCEPRHQPVCPRVGRMTPDLSKFELKFHGYHRATVIILLLLSILATNKHYYTHAFLIFNFVVWLGSVKIVMINSIFEISWSSCVVAVIDQLWTVKWDPCIAAPTGVFLSPQQGKTSDSSSSCRQVIVMQLYPQPNQNQWWHWCHIHSRPLY